MKGHIAAQIGRDAATDQNSADFKTLSSLMCWDAVAEVQAKAGMKRQTDIGGKKCDHVVSLSDQPITGKQEMQSVPQGAFIGFFRDGTLIHAMLATGAGIAAGNKNECIGIGRPVGWELLNLAADLNWGGSGFTDPGGRLTLVRYRAAKG